MKFGVTITRGTEGFSSGVYLKLGVDEGPPGCCILRYVHDHLIRYGRMVLAMRH